jgi:O-antigen/teichoic acid export membrane protein
MSLIDEPEQPLALPAWKRLVATFFSKDNLNSLIYFASSLFGAALGFFTLPYFTHFMPKAEIGLYGYALAVNTFILPILLLSVESFYLRTVYSEQDEGSKRVLLGSLVLFVFIWSVVLVGLLLLFGPLLFHAAGIRIPFYPTIALILTSNVLSVFTVFALLNFRIKGQAWHYFALTAFQNVAITGTSLLLIYYCYRDAFGRILGTSWPFTRSRSSMLRSR